MKGPESGEQKSKMQEHSEENVKNQLAENEEHARLARERQASNLAAIRARRAGGGAGGEARV